MRILKWWGKVITFLQLKCLGALLLCQKFCVWTLGLLGTSRERLVLSDFEEVVNLHLIISLPILQIAHLLDDYAIWSLLLVRNHVNAFLLLVLCTTSSHHRWELSLLHLWSLSGISWLVLTLDVRWGTHDYWAWILSLTQLTSIGGIVISWPWHSWQEGQ